MRSPRLLAALELLLLALVAGSAVATASPEHPFFEIDAPPELQPVAERLLRVPDERIARVQRLVGLEEAGAPIRLTLARETDPVARNTPLWVSGFAYGSLGAIVLFPERSPTYPDHSLEELLLHEVAHVFIARAAGYKEVPRWFNEGLAMLAAGAWSLEDRGRVTWGALRHANASLADLDLLFADGEGAVQRAYALSGAFVRDLLQRNSPALAADILDRLSRGSSFDAAFEQSAGMSLAHAESLFWRRYSLWYRWVPALTSTFTLWLGITLLALVAAWRKRRQRALLEAAWAESEQNQALQADGNGLVN